MPGIRTRITLLLSALVLASVGIAGCGDNGPVSPNPFTPYHVTVRYLLVGFTGSVPGQTITRTKAEAQLLADSLYLRARGGDDFSTLVATWSDGAGPDSLRLANYGVVIESGEVPRGAVVKSFGDVAFTVAPDSIGLAVYDSVTCPYGWFVIKRLR
ncbi:MAG: peptidylprolyl isomerase [Anaerolineaceae bacterium]